MKISNRPCSKSHKDFYTLKNYIKRKNNGTRKRYNKSRLQIREYIKKIKNEKNALPKVIPLDIYQVWHNKTSIPKSVKESIELIKEQNPEFIHHLYDEKECREFIEKNFSKRILKAYDSVVPHAIKADLWRYCVMYKNGGIYLDSKYYCINGFKLILLTDKEYFCRDIEHSLYGIYNAFLICKPKNKIMLKCINQSVRNIEKKYYGPGGLCPTGPLMMKEFFTVKQINNLELRHEFVNDKMRFINLNGYRVLKYNEKYFDEKVHKNHWGTYWKSRTMYNEESAD
jgi:mannosyltransferase OCH1-like enzyme